MGNEWQIHESWIYRQSAVVPYRFRNGELEILLISSRKKKHWVIPKGIVEPELTPLDSAVKEAWEEAGVTGSVPANGSIGNYKYRKWGGTCRVQVFLLAVTEIVEDWPESGFRDRKWVKVHEAVKMTEDQAGLQKILRSLPESLKLFAADRDTEREIEL